MNWRLAVVPLSVVLFSFVHPDFYKPCWLSRRVRGEDEIARNISFLFSNEPGERLRGLHNLVRIYHGLESDRDVTEFGQEGQAFYNHRKIAFAILNAFWKENDAYVFTELYKYLGQVILAPENTPPELRRELQEAVLEKYLEARNLNDNELVDRAELVLKDKKFLSIAVIGDKIIFDSQFYRFFDEFISRLNGFYKTKVLSEILLALDDLFGLEGWLEEFMDEQNVPSQDRVGLITLGILTLYREIGQILEGGNSLFLEPEEVSEVRRALEHLTMDSEDEDTFEILRDFIVTVVADVVEEELILEQQKDSRFGLAINYYFQDSDTYNYVKLLFNILGIEEIHSPFSYKSFLLPLQAGGDSVLNIFEGVKELNIINNHSSINFVVYSPYGGEKGKELDALGWYLAGLAPPIGMKPIFPFILGQKEKSQVVYFLPLREELSPYVTYALPVVWEYSRSSVRKMIKRVFSKFSVTREEMGAYVQEIEFARMISPQEAQFFREVMELLPWEGDVLYLDRVVDIPCIGNSEYTPSRESDNFYKKIMAGMLAVEAVKFQYAHRGLSFAQLLISQLGL